MSGRKGEAVEEGEEETPEKVERTRLGPAQSSAHFGELKPDTDYRMGVVAYV
jgi:hypothetical protein